MVGQQRPASLRGGAAAQPAPAAAIAAVKRRVGPIVVLKAAQPLAPALWCLLRVWPAKAQATGHRRKLLSDANQINGHSDLNISRFTERTA